MDLNRTTTRISPALQKPQFPGYYALVLFVLVILIGSAVAMVFYIKRRARLDELRHRLIPLYSYDPAEEDDDWGDADMRNEEEELAEPLYKEAKLSFSSSYGTEQKIK